MGSKDVADIIKKARDLIYESVYLTLLDAAKVAVREAAETRVFQQFTGQTVSSYACGVYMQGKLVEYIVNDSITVHVKIRENEAVRLENPVEGKARTVKGQVVVYNDSGVELSVDILTQMQSRFGRNDFGLILTTGTEYSIYLEKFRHLDVLSQMKKELPGILKNNLQPIK